LRHPHIFFHKYTYYIVYFQEPAEIGISEEVLQKVSYWCLTSFVQNICSSLVMSMKIKGIKVANFILFQKLYFDEFACAQHLLKTVL